MASSPRYEATVYLSWRHNLYHMSKTLMGLLTTDSILCRFANRREMGDRSFSADPAVLFIRVAETGTGRQALACIDQWDRNDCFAVGALERCEVYFKRSFHPERVSELPIHLHDKVLPFGLNYACCDLRTKERLLRHRGIQLLLASPGSHREVIQWARQEAEQYKAFILSPPAADFEKAPTSRPSPWSCFRLASGNRAGLTRRTQSELTKNALCWSANCGIDLGTNLSVAWHRLHTQGARIRNWYRPFRQNGPAMLR